jgi:hypothetical protein
MIHGDKRPNQPPFVRGNRRKVFKIIYDSHHGHQSEQAHQRAAAVSAALVVDESAQWSPGLGESGLISDTILFLTCIISELESKGRYPAHQNSKNSGFTSSNSMPRRTNCGGCGIAHCSMRKARLSPKTVLCGQAKEEISGAWNQ